MKNENVLVFSCGNVGHIALDAPLKNVITSKSFERIFSELDELEKDPNIKTLVYHGMNGNFSAGADLEWMHALQNSPEKARETVDFMYRVALRIGTFSKPTIAAIEKGKCYGIGPEIMMNCDRVVAMEKNASTIEFAALAPRYLFMLGLGISWHLVRKMGFLNAARFLLDTGSTNLATAHRRCMVDYILPGDDFPEAVHQFAQEMLNGQKPKKMAFHLGERLNPSQIENLAEKCGSMCFVSKTLAALEACEKAGTLEEAMNIEKRFFLELFLSENAKKRVGEFLQETKRKKALCNNVAVLKIA